jgi:hypothetical protein
MKHEKREFTRYRVDLDGNEYVGCTFTSCTFVYNGGVDYLLDGNNISGDCRFEFTGAAANTVNTMRAIYGMGPWGRHQILATFQAIAPDMKKLN